MLDFHRCAALGLNEAIVRLGPEGVQKGRPQGWLQKWAHSGCHAERAGLRD